MELEVNVTDSSEHNFYTGFTQNISEGGLFVATALIRPRGTVLEFDFKLDPDPEPIRVRGIVRWIREANGFTDALPSGMGVQFVEIDDELRARLNGFIARRARETIFYDE